jgi:hypothetical protein
MGRCHSELANLQKKSEREKRRKGRLRRQKKLILINVHTTKEEKKGFITITLSATAFSLPSTGVETSLATIVS